VGDDFKWVRCDAVGKWEQMLPTREGNLLCAECWESMDAFRETIRNCPVDGAPMTRRLFFRMALVDQCLICGGTCLDKRELEVFQRQAGEAGLGEGFARGFTVS
jgi:hypothetical protein